jgi:hypothetical protein
MGFRDIPYDMILSTGLPIRGLSVPLLFYREITTQYGSLLPRCFVGKFTADYKNSARVKTNDPSTSRIWVSPVLNLFCSNAPLSMRIVFMN